MHSNMTREKRKAENAKMKQEEDRWSSCMGSIVCVECCMHFFSVYVLYFSFFERSTHAFSLHMHKHNVSNYLCDALTPHMYWWVVNEYECTFFPSSFLFPDFSGVGTQVSIRIHGFWQKKTNKPKTHYYSNMKKKCVCVRFWCEKKLIWGSNDVNVECKCKWFVLA